MSQCGNTGFHVQGRGYTYLEACLRISLNDAAVPMFLSSGAEDYFLSASYFDEGMFQTENSGLTYFDHRGGLSAYKSHERDPVFWHDGMEVTWRNYEQVGGCGNATHCPSMFCRNDTQNHRRWHMPHETKATYSTLLWTYEWPSKTTPTRPLQTDPELEKLLQVVLQLHEKGITSEAEDAQLVDHVLKGDKKLCALLAGLSENVLYLGKHVHRYLHELNAPAEV